MNNERGFVLIEFVIALPLIMMLLYGLTETTLQIFRLAKSQAADYVLEVEAQDVLTRITQDLRAASFVICYNSDIYQYGSKCQNITIKYHTNSTSYNQLKGNKITIVTNEDQIFDIMDTRAYVVAKTADHEPYIYAQRKNNYHTSPVTGGNFFGDTEVTCLKYEEIGDRVLKITLELKSSETKRIIKLSTAVFMPACEKIEFLPS